MYALSKHLWNLLIFSFHKNNFFTGKKTVVETISVAITEGSDVWCFLFYSPILLTFWFKYLQTHIKENSMYLSSQLLFKTPTKTLKLLEKSNKNAIFTNPQT